MQLANKVTLKLISQHKTGRFRALGRLENKHDETLVEYYLAFMAMCKRVAGLPLSEEEGKKHLAGFISYALSCCHLFYFK